jgi:hypothetical protein
MFKEFSEPRMFSFLWVYWNVSILTPLIGVLIANGLFSIANTIKVMSGDPFIKVPFIRYEKKDVQPK